MLNVSYSLQIILKFEFINCHLQGKVLKKNTSPIRLRVFLTFWILDLGLTIVELITFSNIRFIVKPQAKVQSQSLTDNMKFRRAICLSLFIQFETDVLKRTSKLLSGSHPQYYKTLSCSEFNLIKNQKSVLGLNIVQHPVYFLTAVP